MSGSNLYSLSDIFNLATVEDVTNDQYYQSELTRLGLGFDRDTAGEVIDEEMQTMLSEFKKSVSYRARMPLSSSIEVFGKTKLKKQEYDSEGNPIAISSANDTELDTWVIYTKFELSLIHISEPTRPY